MRGSLTGDFAALERFGKKVGDLGGSRALTALNKALGAEAIVQARDGFREERDPYGQKWAKKVFPDGNKILRKSEKLYGGWYLSSVSSSGYTLSNKQFYAKFHQSGTGEFGPKKTRIYPKSKKALRIPGPVNRGAGGRFTSGAQFFASVKGSPQRLMVPVPGRPSPIWMRSLKQAATKFLVDRFRK
jgi:hypothetical protein